MLQAEKGVTLGLLKLLYSSDSTNFGALLGVKPRGATGTQHIITSDGVTLDKNEYELIIKGAFQLI